MSNSSEELHDHIPSATSPRSNDDLDTKNTEDHIEKELTHDNNHNKQQTPHKIKKVEWSPENELIMVEWCDVAQCYKWLNSQSHHHYSRLHAWFTIPAIIFSTISGTASFAMDSIPEEFQHIAPAIIGSINITIGILTTIQQYLKISELNEAHRVSSIAWDKFARNIRIELSKKPIERTDAGSFIKHNRSEFDRLMETSPDINPKIIKEFKNKFSGSVGTLKRQRYEQLRKPDICDTIISANETRHKWYLELENDHDDDDLTDEAKTALAKKNKLIQEQTQMIEQKNMEIQQQQDFEKQKIEMEAETLRKKIQGQKELELKKVEKDKLIQDRLNKIKTYVHSFSEIYARKPLREEIIDNVSSDVDKDILDLFFQTYRIDDNV